MKARTVLALTAVSAALGAALIPAAASATSVRAANPTVISFNGANGSTPTSAPICVKGQASTFGGADMCFGATFVGGPTNNGTIWQATPDLRTFRTIGTFDLANGLTPSQAPVMNADGTALFGATTQAGASGLGVIYTYDLTKSASTNPLTAIASFTPATGTTSQASPIIVGDTLYGTTGQNGKRQGGTIWKFDTKTPGSKIEVLHNFAPSSKSDVAIPFGALTYNPADGLLYGQAFNGGKNSLGGVFSINPNGTDYRIRLNFTKTTGGMPQMGALLLSKDGSLYSNTWIAGAHNGGAVLKFDPAANSSNVVFNYNSTTGVSPYNSLAESPSGIFLYSITWRGNAKGGLGAIIAIEKASGKATVLHNFKRSEGALTFSGATVSPDGTRILTQMGAGGKSGIGTVLSFVIPSAFR
ncbi:MAG: choice-of-anchor tandem repeat GloVer-containing protein [Gaiellales bacterium]